MNGKGTWSAAEALMTLGTTIQGAAPLLHHNDIIGMLYIVSFQ